VELQRGSATIHLCPSQDGFRHAVTIVHYSVCVNKTKTELQQSTRIHNPIAFTTLKSHEAFETTHLRSMASFMMSFVCMHTKYLAQQKLNITCDCWIFLSVHCDRERYFVLHRWLGAWTDAWVIDFSIHTKDV